MARCCDDNSCGLVAGPGVLISGDGSIADPYVVENDPAQPQLIRLLPSPEGLKYSELSPALFGLTSVPAVTHTVTVTTPGAGLYTVKVDWIGRVVDDSSGTFDPTGQIVARLIIDGVPQPKPQIGQFTQTTSLTARVQNQWAVIGAAMGATFDVEAEVSIQGVPGATADITDQLMIVETRTA